MTEFSRLCDIRNLPADPVRIAAETGECAALARRFDLVAVKAFSAELTLEPIGPAVVVRGRITAQVVQSCAVSGEDLPARIDAPVFLRFVPADRPNLPNEEIELAAEDCDEIALNGTQFDLGEAIAQELALAIDPFAVGPTADEARRQAGLLDPAETGPFSALKALKQ